MSEPASHGSAMDEAAIRARVAAIAAGALDAEAAWEQLRPLGAVVVPYLAEAFARARRWQGRAALLYHVIPHARTTESAFQLGLMALEDRSHVVRHRACMVLAYALDPRAIPALRLAAAHADARTAADAGAALDAIEHRNHHLFVDRSHSGRSFWKVNEGDVPEA